MIIQRVGIMSLARLLAAIYGLFGLIWGIVFTVGALVGFGISEEVAKTASWLGPFFGVGAVIVVPVVYAIMGYLSGLVAGWAFNNAAETMGGLHVELTQMG